MAYYINVAEWTSDQVTEWLKGEKSSIELLVQNPLYHSNLQSVILINFFNTKLLLNSDFKRLSIIY
jgi:hypothetical protein